MIYFTYTQIMSHEIGSSFAIDGWHVFPERGLLRGQNGDVHIEPKVMEVLVFLAERPGEVVRRDELIDKVWAGTIVNDEVLSRAISVLRQSLGDDRLSPRYIQTLPKVGYRLIAPVKQDVASEFLSWNRWTTRKRAVVMLVVAAFLFTIGTSFRTEDPTINSDSPAAFAEIADWFDFLWDQKAGTSDAIAIAVLPWRQLTDESKYEYLGENLTDEVMVALNRVKGLKVLSRPTVYSFSYRENYPLAGQMPGVDVVLEGSVRPDGDEVRFTAQLSDVAEGYLLWSDTFVVPTGELFELKEKLTLQVVESLNQRFTRTTLWLPSDPATSPDKDAYRVYLATPNYLTKMRGERPLRQSIEQYRAVLAIDQDFARASIGLAKALVLLPFYSNEPMEPLFEQAEAVLDSTVFSEVRDMGEAESVRGFIAWNRWQWIEAEQRFRSALALAPDVANIYQWYSQHLAHVGRKQDSLAAAQKARELDNVSPPVIDRLGVAYLWQDDNLKAAEQFAVSSRLGFKDTHNPVYLLLYLRTGQIDRFKQAMVSFHASSDISVDWIIENADLLFDPDDFDEFTELALETTRSGQSIRPRLILPLWLYVGDDDLAYQTIEMLKNSGRQHLPMEMIFASEGQSFRTDSRFDDFSDQVGWTAYWDTFGEHDEK